MTSEPSTSGSRLASRCAAAALLALTMAGAGAAQEPDASQAAVPPMPVATLDSEALFLGSQFGQRVQEGLERDSEALAAENRRIEAELIAEERRLTEQRGSLPPEEFARLAAEFDSKVQRIRAEQDRKARSLQERLEDSRQRFLAAAGPVLAELLRARRASVLLDANTVLIAVEGVDITERAIAAMDARYGDGGLPALTAPTQDPLPEVPPPPETAPE